MWRTEALGCLCPKWKFSAIRICCIFKTMIFTNMLSFLTEKYKNRNVVPKPLFSMLIKNHLGAEILSGCGVHSCIHQLSSTFSSVVWSTCFFLTQCILCTEIPLEMRCKFIKLGLHESCFEALRWVKLVTQVWCSAIQIPILYLWEYAIQYQVEFTMCNMNIQQYFVPKPLFYILPQNHNGHWSSPWIWSY